MRNRLSQFGLVYRFAAGALATFAVVTIVLLVIVSNQLRTSQESAAQDHAVFITNSVLRYELTPADLSGPVTRARADALQAFIQARVLAYPTLRIKIWAPDGIIVFSDDFRAIGLHFMDDVEEKAQDTNTAISELASPTDPENIYDRYLGSKLFSTYVPLHLVGESTRTPQGIIEVYQDYAGIQAVIDSQARALIITLVVALFGLFLLLLPLVSRAARDLRLRNLALGTSERRFRSLVQNSSDVTAIVSATSAVTYVSPSVTGVFGIDTTDVLDRPIGTFAHPDDRDALQQILELAAANPSISYSLQCRWKHRDGSWRNGESIVTGHLSDDSICGIVVNTRDVTPRWVMEQQLLQQAFHDPLTGLANRALLGDRLQQTLDRGRREGIPTSIVFIDLDDFKTVNDSLGHSAGDALLLAVGNRIRTVLRPADTAARLGGDEFAVLVEEATLAQGIEVAERILGAFTAPFDVEGREITISASAGITVSTGDGASADDMLRNADIAMYSAKSHGKAQYAVYHAEMHQATMDRLEMRTGLEAALARKEFVLHYQPVVNLRAAGQVTGFEALIRWNHPDRGLVPPLQFIPVAEESGVIIPIGRWVLLQACLDAEAMRRRHPDCSGLVMGVNLSMRQLRSAGIVADVGTALEESGLPPANLVLEVTESLVMNEPEEVIARIRELKELGVRIALDDFGTGYSSLSYLQQLPIDILKIDRSFVSGVSEAAQDWSLCGAVVKIAESLHLETIAEGIETDEQNSRLVALGCTEGQGFLFHRAVPFDDAEALLESSRRHVPVPVPF